jgi:molecular chaperone GrpE
MNTPANIPRLGVPDPENAPTAPPMMLSLLRRRKTQYLLRRRNLSPSVMAPDKKQAKMLDGGDVTADDESLHALRQELARERDAKRLAEAGTLAAKAGTADLETRAEGLRLDLDNQKLRHEEAIKQLEEAKAFVLRARADMEHQRKRFQKEREELQRTAAEETLRQLFPVLDNFTYAIDLNDQGKQDLESLAKGMMMVFREFKSILGRLGLEPIMEVGEQFDPTFHDAASAGNDPTKPDNSVLLILRPGYRLGGKVLRPAMVSVNKHHNLTVLPPVTEMAPTAENTTALPPPDEDPASETVSPEERLSGLTPIQRANRMFDTKF